MAGRACFHGRAGLHLSQCQMVNAVVIKNPRQDHGEFVPDDRRE